MDDPHYAALRHLAVRTSRTIREPLHDLVGKPRTHRYFLKTLRGKLGGYSDDDIREACFALEHEFRPPKIKRPIKSKRWLGEIAKLLIAMEPGRFYKLHELTRIGRQRYGWHREYTINVLIVAEDRNVLATIRDVWHRRSRPNEQGPKAENHPSPPLQAHGEGGRRGHQAKLPAAS
jgi:hypothetical protein